MSSSNDLGSASPGLIPLGQIKQEPDLHTPSRRRAKLKPDLKLKVDNIDYLLLYLFDYVHVCFSARDKAVNLLILSVIAKVFV